MKRPPRQIEIPFMTEVILVLLGVLLLKLTVMLNVLPLAFGAVWVVVIAAVVIRSTDGKHYWRE